MRLRRLIALGNLLRRRGLLYRFGGGPVHRMELLAEEIADAALGFGVEIIALIRPTRQYQAGARSGHLGHSTEVHVIGLDVIVKLIFPFTDGLEPMEAPVFGADVAIEHLVGRLHRIGKDQPFDVLIA